MAHTIFKDNSQTTIDEVISAAVTSFDVADGTLIPSPGTNQIAYATLRRKLTGANEVISYTTVTSNTVSGIVRNVNGVGALTFGIGDLFEIRIPEIVLNQFIQRQGDNTQGDNDVTGDLYWGNTDGPVVMNVASSATVPPFVPDQAVLTAGYGGFDGELDLITNSLSRLKISADGNTITLEDEVAWATAVMGTIGPDLKTLTAPAADGEFIVATGVGAFQYETGDTALTSLGLTAYMLNLIDDADASAARTTLELNAGETGDIWVEKGGDAMVGALAMGTNKITGLGDPSDPQDAMTKANADASYDPIGSAVAMAIALG